jgi:hypothetical protein
VGDGREQEVATMALACPELVARVAGSVIEGVGDELAAIDGSSA